MIWDLHCHITSGFPGRTPEERMAQLIRFADRMGIERVCVYMGMKTIVDPNPKELRQQNDEVLQALSHWHDRAFGFVYLNPNYPEASLKELERCVRDGPMVGVKLWVACRCNDPKLDPIIDRATELQAVIFQHTWFKTAPVAQGNDNWTRLGAGNAPGESSPQDVVELMKRHPKASIICGHTGGNWELGVRVVRDLPNVAVDLAGSDPTRGITELAVRELGPERVIYGSDIPGRSFASQLAKVHGADIAEAAKKLIFKENLKRWLTPILKDKGMKP
ncbi:MAG TPA: amidohydrolase family protein [Gemmataceae bacterium]|nr:amidohydrolase family protein [Gemmataceae bacterium]